MVATTAMYLKCDEPGCEATLDLENRELRHDCSAIEARIRTAGWRTMVGLLGEPDARDIRTRSSELHFCPTHGKPSVRPLPDAPPISKADQLRKLIPPARAACARVGSMHADWDVIFTAEATLADKSYWPYGSREEAIDKCLLYLQRYAAPVGATL